MGYTKTSQLNILLTIIGELLRFNTHEVKIFFCLSKVSSIIFGIIA